MTELEIPDESVATLKRCAAIGAYDQASAEAGENPVEDVRAIAAPVVAAELRRLFDEIVTAWDAGDLSSTMDGFRMIRDRARDLDGRPP